MQSPSLKGSETISKRSPYILMCMGAVKPRSLIFAQLSDAIRTVLNRFLPVCDTVCFQRLLVQPLRDFFSLCDRWH
jgi:hypothetical protein